MNEKRATLEVIAPSVDEAVAKGLADLGLPAEAVEVEVLDAGSRGLFGLGSRQARVRLLVKAAEKPVVSSTEPPARVVPSEPPARRKERPEESPAPTTPAGETAGTEDEDEVLKVARETVSELLEKMKVTARVVARHGEKDPDSTRVPLCVDVFGDDLSILIGRRAETLNALQYISGLIVSKEIGHSVSIVVDVEGYRSRRESQIRQIARRMAEQAIKTGRRQILEPMPASERRIIHMELRENPYVRTESIGEEPRRKVTIIPKEH